MIGKSENPELDPRDLYNKAPVDLDEYTPDKVGFFYVYNSKFKNIMETTSYPELKELVILRKPTKKAVAKQEDEWELFISMALNLNIFYLQCIKYIKIITKRFSIYFLF